MSWKEKTVNTYLVAESEELAYDEANVVASAPVQSDLGGKKILAAIDITTAGANQTTPLRIDYSFDGENWTSGANSKEVAANIGSNAAGFKLYQVDLTNIRAPYYRFSIVPGGSLGTNGRLVFHYAIPAKDVV